MFFEFDSIDEYEAEVVNLKKDLFLMRKYRLIKIVVWSILLIICGIVIVDISVFISKNYIFCISLIILLVIFFCNFKIETKDNEGSQMIYILTSSFNRDIRNEKHDIKRIKRLIYLLKNDLNLDTEAQDIVFKLGAGIRF